MKSVDSPTPNELKVVFPELGDFVSKMMIIQLKRL
jgi:hypothetical protein